MLTEYTTPGESIEIRDDQTIYSLLTERLARTGADTVIAAKKIGPGRWQNVTTGEFHERVVSAAKGVECDKPRYPDFYAALNTKTDAGK